MIDHMLVNLKKYYEGKFPCYIGMNIKAPKSSLPAYYIAENPVDGADMLPSTAKPSLTPAELENKEVIAQRLNGLDDFYLLIQPAGYYSYINCWIKLSDLIQNGGVSHSLLTHVCHALSLVRKVLSMAIEKMKFQLKDWYEIAAPVYGKSIIPPKRPIKKYAWNFMPDGTFTPSGKIARIQGFKNDTNPYITTDPVDASNDPSWFSWQDLIQNRGVSSSPLTHLYQGLRHLLNRKVA